MTVSIWSLMATPFVMFALLWLLEYPDRRIKRQIKAERNAWRKANGLDELD